MNPFLPPTYYPDDPVGAVLAQHCKRAAAVSLTGVLTVLGCTDHMVCDPVLAVSGPALLVGDGGDVHLLQDVRPGTCGVQSPPASHHGGHRLVLLVSIRQADWLHN